VGPTRSLRDRDRFEGRTSYSGSDRGGKVFSGRSTNQRKMHFESTSTGDSPAFAATRRREVCFGKG